MLSWSTQDSDGAVSYPPGQDAVTQLFYDDSGRMSVQLRRQNQQRFSSRDWREADADEKAKTWGDYFGYFGRYELNEAGHTVIHHIEDSWFPNLVGTNEIRHYRFERRPTHPRRRYPNGVACLSFGKEQRTIEDHLG